jgi:PAS domain S-box-containing protein
MVDESRPMILVVEDDPGVATLQRRRLERAEFRVEVASDVPAAMTALQRGGIDLVVMDYRLGTTTGLDLHRQMKAAGHDVPVIIVTGSTDDAVVIEAMRAGIRDFVVKTTDYLDYLPDAARGILKQAVAVPERLPTAHQQPAVLIVEDDPGVATLERRQLERAGYAVTVAATVDDAMTIVRTGRINLAVLDLRLGAGTSGLDLYERMKAEGWNIPAILVTGFPDEEVAIRALRAGIRDFVPKSTEYLEHLPAAVDRVVAQARIERKLVDSELRLASIIGTTMDAIVMCDQALTIVLFNRSAEEMFGCGAADALGRRLDTFMPTLHVGDAAGPSAEKNERLQRRLELDGVRCSGDLVPIEVTVSDVVVFGTRLFTVIARDISERRRIEGELREADRRKDEFLGMLAHELRNPLAAIMNAGEVLDRTLTDSRSRKLTGVVRRQTRALARMVDDLLDVSRVTLGKIRLTKEPLLLSQVVTRAAESVREAIAKGQQELEVQVEADPVWLDADATRLDQVLANLLNNAMKFTPAGGRITLSAGREGQDAVIRVRDTGVGIDASVLPTVFDLFVQADTSLDRAQSGLGIGLALVRQVVMLHGGQVTAASGGLGQGSEFLVRLPAVADERAPDRETVAAHQSHPGRMRILVVDDQPDMADCVALLIETLGHQARAVYDGATAMAITRSEAPDVMFVDIGMPGMTGYDVARQVRLRADLSQVRLVALTGYGRDEDRSRALEAGFDLHLTKPVADATLRDVLSEFAPARATKTD